MRRNSLPLVLFLAVAANACNNLDEVVPTPTIPTAGVRFIHAVPDTGALDMRFVDIVENNAHFRIAYRNNPVTSGGVTASTLVLYRPAKAGTRNFVIFQNDTNQTIADNELKDTVVTLVEGKNYTALLWGNGRGTPAMRLDFFEETEAPDTSTSVSLRVMNATGVTIDAEQYTSTGAATGTPTTGWTSIPSLSMSPYFTRATGQVRIRVRSPAAGASLFTTDPLALVGAAASFSGDTSCGGTNQPQCDMQRIPGTTMAGSAVTMIVFPRSTAGSPAPSTFTTSAASFIWDRRPPKGCTFC